MSECKTQRTGCVGTMEDERWQDDDANSLWNLFLLLEWQADSKR